jgi:hypothetical protein
LGTKAFVDEMVKSLAGRQAEIIADRYGLWDGISETLQDIGNKHSLTRERIRQLEQNALSRLRALVRRSKSNEFLRRKLIKAVSLHDDKNGVVTKDEIIAGLGDDCTFEEVGLAIALIEDIEGTGADLISQNLTEAEEGIYCVDSSNASEYVGVLKLVQAVLEEAARPMAEQEVRERVSARFPAESKTQKVATLERVLAVSPRVARFRNGQVVLSKWSAFRKRDAVSLAEAALMIAGRPLHFTEITQRIGTQFPELPAIEERTIHNRLVSRSDKFVWVKNGTYGLKAWGLKRPPYLKDKLIELLSDASYPLPYWYLKEKALEVCNCKETSVRMTLDLNPKVFKRFPDDQYGLRSHFQ